MDPNAPGFPLTQAIPGRPVSIPAYDWNAIAARTANGAQAPPDRPPPTPAGPCSYILLRNDDPANIIWQGAAIPLGNCLTPHYHYAVHSPSGSATPDTFDHDDLAVFAGAFGLPKWPGHFCLALEPIPRGKEGLAIVNGMAWHVWYQLPLNGGYRDTPNSLDLDLCTGYGGAPSGYLGRGFPGRGRIVWAPDIETPRPAWFDGYGGAYVHGLIVLGNQPPTPYELATTGTAVTTLTTDGNVQGYFQAWLPAFKTLTAATPAWPFQRIDDSTVQALVSGAFRVDYAAQIGPGTIANPWPDNSPARTLKHTYRLRPQLSSNAAGTSAITAGKAAERSDVYPAATVSAEAWDVLQITRGQYLKLNLDGYAPGAAAYGSVAHARFTGRLVNHTPTTDETNEWNAAHSPV